MIRGGERSDGGVKALGESPQRVTGFHRIGRHHFICRGTHRARPARECEFSEQFEPETRASLLRQEFFSLRAEITDAQHVELSRHALIEAFLNALLEFAQTIDVPLRRRRV